MEYIQWCIDNYMVVVGAVLQIVGGASIIVKLTPTKKDDEILGKITSFLKLISLNK